MSGYGIDFGTTNSIVAQFSPGEREPVTVLADPDGRPHPSVVWYRVGVPPIVGRRAKDNINRMAQVTGNAFVSSIKRRLGQRVALDILAEEKEAWEVASDIFAHLLAHAEEHGGKRVRDAVVTIPVRFEGRARRDLRMAADRAGLHITTFVHEPFAAVVGYLGGGREAATLRAWEGRTVLVFDWGGGTLDVTVAKATRDGLVELATRGLADRSGDYFDELVLGAARRHAAGQLGLKPDEVRVAPNMQDTLLKECESAKIALSDRLVSAVQLVGALRTPRGPAELGEMALARDEFEELIAAVVDDAAELVQQALDAARLTARQIDDVLLIGGTSRIPLVRTRLHDIFGARLIQVDNADTIIAEGAAIVAALGMQPFLARSLAISLADGSHFPVFPAGRPAVSGSCDETLHLFCTDHRDGFARLIIVESREYDDTGLYASKKLLPIPVSAELRKAYTPERVAVHFALDQDLVLRISGKAATKAEGAVAEIEDLSFGLTYGGE